MLSMDKVKFVVIAAPAFVPSVRLASSETRHKKTFIPVMSKIVVRKREYRTKWRENVDVVI